MNPDQGRNPQSGHVLWWGMELVIFQCTGHCSTDRATWARAWIPVFFNRAWWPPQVSLGLEHLANLLLPPHSCFITSILSLSPTLSWNTSPHASLVQRGFGLGPGVRLGLGLGLGYQEREASLPFPHTLILPTAILYLLQTLSKRACVLWL